jgi:membrane protease YdiL (CAAX protease family)
MQSRLDQAFGKPYAFGGVQFGWGVIITSLLFGLLHVTNGGDPVTRTFVPQWAWGLWTFFGGLASGYVREKTGSIVAPTILHGLPQALVHFFLRL